MFLYSMSENKVAVVCPLRQRPHEKVELPCSQHEEGFRVIWQRWHPQLKMHSATPDPPDPEPNC